MEDHRDEICIILAGYTEEMKELIKRNPGFESRIQFTINFPDYTSEELLELSKKYMKTEYGVYLKDLAENKYGQE